jgi:uncharacterized protein
MFDINPLGKKMILSIDGGGMRGTIAVAMLAELEAITGVPTYEQFDMVAGTSTGAIITAGLGIGMSAQDLLERVYKDHLPNAFRSQGGRWLRFVFSGLRHFYELEPFRLALQQFAEGKRIGDLKAPIVFMTTKDVRTSKTYYVVSKGPGRKLFADWPVSGAVAASGAAPIYFPPVAGNLVDGGVGLNGNPCLAATIEAMEYISLEDSAYRDGNVIHISLGTGYMPYTFEDGAASRFWLKDWVQYVIAESLDDAWLEQVFSTRAIYGGRIDFRRYNPYLLAASIRDELGVLLKKRPNPANLGLDAYKRRQVQLMEDIGRAYARKVDWLASDYVPWVEKGIDKGKGKDGGHPLPEIKPVDWAKTPYR